MLEKTQTVMEIDTRTRVFPAGTKVVPFVTEDRNHEMGLDFGVWEDFGQPEAITVTVEPGDLLNA